MFDDSSDLDSQTNQPRFLQSSDIEQLKLDLKLNNVKYLQLIEANILNSCENICNFVDTVPIPTTWDGTRDFTTISQPMVSTVAFYCAEKKVHVRMNSHFCFIHYRDCTIITKCFTTKYSNNVINVKHSQLTPTDYCIDTIQVTNPLAVIIIGNYFISNEPILYKDVLLHVSQQILKLSPKVVIYNSLSENIINILKEMILTCQPNVEDVHEQMRFSYHNDSDLLQPTTEMKYLKKSRHIFHFKINNHFKYPNNLKCIDQEFIMWYDKKDQMLFYCMDQLQKDNEFDHCTMQYILRRLESFY